MSLLCRLAEKGGLRVREVSKRGQLVSLVKLLSQANLLGGLDLECEISKRCCEISKR